MDDVVCILKAFGADLFGEYIRDTFFESSSKNTSQFSLSCRIDDQILMHLMNVLSIWFHIEMKSMSGCKVNMGLVPLEEERNDTSIDLHLVRMPYTKWHEIPVDFDVNMLVSNSQAVFVRPSTVFTHPSTIESLRNRIAKKRFALVTVPCFPIRNALGLLQKSHEMVSNGWTMDDAYTRRSSWVINKWSVFKNSISSVRKSFNARERKATLEQSQCCLCHDVFEDDDIVMNTSCNHNFHWRCCPDDQHNMSGISSWFNLKQEFICPYCRQNAIKVNI